MFVNTENRISLRILDTAQWGRCAAKFLCISANILLFGKSHFCLYLSQISMDLNSVKKGHFASVLPQLLCTHLTSSFNIRWVQIWPRTFPLCIACLYVTLFEKCHKSSIFPCATSKHHALV